MIGKVFGLLLCVAILWCPFVICMGDYSERMQEQKAAKLQKLIRGIEAELEIPSFLKMSDGSPAHHPDGPAVFAVAMDKYMGVLNSKLFSGSLRRTGYAGDIVLAIAEGSKTAFLEHVKKTSSISYVVKTTSTTMGTQTFHQFNNFTIPHSSFGYSLNVLRLYLYKWWASMYRPSAYILLSDYRDVLFQQNPFNYQPKRWMSPLYQLNIVFENFPQKMIYRCPSNLGWLFTCYDSNKTSDIRYNYVSCSGTSLGTRDAILAYSHIMIEQINPEVRWHDDPRVGEAEFIYNMQKQCRQQGIDQGFHNYLVHTGALDMFMNVKRWNQGEGPINTIGAFFGERGVLQMHLREWGVMRGAAPNITFHNWNGDLSPVVHQVDRFQISYFEGKYWEHIKVISDQYPK
jgi:hypothetical protein